jgi:serine protease
MFRTEMLRYAVNAAAVRVTGVQQVAASLTRELCSDGQQLLVGGPDEVSKIGTRAGAASTLRPLCWTGRDDATHAMLAAGEVLVRVRPHVAATQIADLAKLVSGRVVRGYTLVAGLYLIQLPSDDLTRLIDACRQLARREEVVYAHPNLYCQTAARAAGAFVAAAPAAAIPWHLERIGVPAAWQATTGDPAVTVCIYDSGVDETHPAFAGRYLGGYNAIDGTGSAAAPLFLTHGTQCAGLAVAAPGVGQNVSGVAPACTLVAIRKPDLSSYDQIIRGFQQADILGASVVNCSWGISGGWDLPPAVNDCFAALASAGRGGKGVLIVWAAGNEAESIDIDEWASSPHVLAVGSVDDTDQHAVYSDFGAALDVCAASSATILSDGVHQMLATTTNRGGFVYDFGANSGSAAIVSGAAALVQSTRGSASAADVRRAIETTCVKVNPADAQYDSSGFSARYGHGRIDVAAACAAIHATT